MAKVLLQFLTCPVKEDLGPGESLPVGGDNIGLDSVSLGVKLLHVPTLRLLMHNNESFTGQEDVLNLCLHVCDIKAEDPDTI